MQQNQQMMIFMLLVVMALMMSRDTHKLFAETTRTWAQFGSTNYKAISALTTFAMLAIGRGVYKNRLNIARQQEELDATLAMQQIYAQTPRGAPYLARQENKGSARRIAGMTKAFPPNKMRPIGQNPTLTPIEAAGGSRNIDRS